MVRELEIIFALDAVAGKLRVARHALVFLEQLRRIAALAVVLAAASGLSAEALSPLPPTAAPAAALSVADQILLPQQEAIPFASGGSRPAQLRQGPDPLVPNCAS
jgi:hypothetical protein